MVQSLSHKNKIAQKPESRIAVVVVMEIVVVVAETVVGNSQQENFIYRKPTIPSRESPIQYKSLHPNVWKTDEEMTVRQTDQQTDGQVVGLKCGGSERGGSNLSPPYSSRPPTPPTPRLPTPPVPESRWASQHVPLFTRATVQSSTHHRPPIQHQ